MAMLISGEEGLESPSTLLIVILDLSFWNTQHVYLSTGISKPLSILSSPLFSFSSSVRLCESDTCWHIFGQGRGSSINGRCPRACEAITPNRSKTVGTLFMHCWKLRYSAEVGQQSIAGPYSEVMTSSWLSAPSQIQALLCVLSALFCVKGHSMRHETQRKSIQKQKINK